MTQQTTSHRRKLITIIIPVYNEEDSIPAVVEAVESVMQSTPYRYEMLFVNDGSSDGSRELLEILDRTRPHIRHIEFSRNFGKEIAITAGLHEAKGDAAICIDADLQHPVELIPEFIKKWEHGAEVVVGIRRVSKSDGIIRRFGSYAFYKIMSRMSEVEFVPRATDFRLIDRIVIDEFNALTEKNRITRGLIDWLGFRRDYIHFDALERKNGRPTYGIARLFHLALVSFTTLSLFPLRLVGYLGVAIIIISTILGMVMTADYFVGHHYSFTGTAILADMILYLIGVVLVSIGILSVYVGNTHQEVQNRPMYVIRRRREESPLFGS